jgi:hypothetical protein
MVKKANPYKFRNKPWKLGSKAKDLPDSPKAINMSGIDWKDKESVVNLADTISANHYTHCIVYERWERGAFKNYMIGHSANIDNTLFTAERLGYEVKPIYDTEKGDLIHVSKVH